MSEEHRQYNNMLKAMIMSRANSMYTKSLKVIWVYVTLMAIKVYKWNEKLLHEDKVAEKKGLLVLRRSSDHLICHTLPLDLKRMVQHPSDPDGYFVPRTKSHTFFRSLSEARCFEPDVAQDLAQELNSFIRACFRFDALTITCPSSPRLVFVVDLSYTELRRVDAPNTRVRCPRFHKQADLIEHSDEEEDSDDDDECISEEDGTTTDDLMESDVEDGYSEEMKDLAWELRNYYGNEERTYPLMPLSKEHPLGLVEVEKKLEIVVVEEVASSLCAICLECLVAGRVAVKTKCGHFFHKKCSLSWFGSNFTCPMCRSNTRCTV